MTKHKLFDEVTVDSMGSLIGVRKPRPETGKTPKKPLKVMLAAHMDQIGFLVRHIDEFSYLRLNPVGGFDPRNLFARKVRVCTARGDLPGVMNASGKPIHIASESDKKKIPEVTDFFVDLGMNGDQVRGKVLIGDMVVLDGPFEEVGNSVVSQCLDNRVGCWAQLKASKKI